MERRGSLEPGPARKAGPTGRPSLPVAGGGQSKLSGFLGVRKSAGPSTAAPPSQKVTCEKCGEGFPTRARMVAHLSRRECGDRQRCCFCGLTFPTFAGVRSHESWKHPAGYAKQLEDLKPRSEVEVLRIFARIEASSINGKFLAQAAAETGLASETVRHKRRKPLYKKYLEQAKHDLAAKARGAFAIAAPSTHAAPLVAVTPDVSSAETLPAPETSEPPQPTPTPVVTRLHEERTPVERIAPVEAEATSASPVPPSAPHTPAPPVLSSVACKSHLC